MKTNGETVAAADDALAQTRGRPSLTGGSVHSPQIAFRVPADVRRRAEEIARREHKTVSQLARDALERYLGAA